MLHLIALGTKRALSQVLRIYALVIFGRGLTRYWSTVGLLEGRQLELNMKITAREVATTLGVVAGIAAFVSYALYVIFTY